MKMPPRWIYLDSICKAEYNCAVTMASTDLREQLDLMKDMYEFLENLEYNLHSPPWDREPLITPQPIIDRFEKWGATIDPETKAFP